MKSYTHFTLDERKNLQEFVKGGWSLREMARALDRAPSSIKRELDRNRSKDGSYHHWRAHTLTAMRQRYCRKQQRIIPGTALYRYIISKLNQFWSPEQVVMRWLKEHPAQTLAVSTIYRYIRDARLGTINRKTHLRRRGKRRLPRGSNYNTIQPPRIIPDWDQAIKDRSRIGDWEGDTVYGGVGKGLITTCVDRRTRYLTAALLPNRNADLTEQTLVKSLKGLPICSLSLDNGAEFANFESLEKALRAPIYFAQPHKPWQRPTNENTNDLLRFFFPKGCNFHEVSDADLQAVVSLINNRPRKCLDWRSPYEAFWGVALP